MKNGCIIGCGAIAPNHAAPLHERGSLYGICDIDNERLNNFKYKDVKKYNSFDDVLSDKNIDVIHICTPHFLHYEMIKKAVSAGKAVVSEKPVTRTYSEFREIIKYAESDAKICVMLQNRTNPCIKRLYEIAKSGEFGKITGGAAYLAWSRTSEYYRHDSWRGKYATEGGGLLINQAIHLIDLCGYIFGGIKSVYGSTSAKTLGDVIEVEDTADAIFTANNGVRICFYATNSHSVGSPMQLEVQFENARVRWIDGRLFKISDAGYELLESDFSPKIGKSYWGCGHESVINSFYGFLETGKGSYINLADSKNAMETLFTFYESAKQNCEIKIGEL